MTKFAGGVVVAVGIAVLLPLVIVPLTILHGLWLATVWNWLAVPAFGAPALSVPAAMALSLLAAALRGNPLAPKPEEKRTGWRIAGTFAGYYGISLLFAYVLRGFL